MKCFIAANVLGIVFCGMAAPVRSDPCCSGGVIDHSPALSDYYPSTENDNTPGFGWNPPVYEYGYGYRPPRAVPRYGAGFGFRSGPVYYYFPGPPAYRVRGFPAYPYYY